MYLCFDESGTHGRSPVLVVGGIIVHEEDAWHLQQRLDTFLFRKLRPLRHDHTMFELHGRGQSAELDESVAHGEQFAWPNARPHPRQRLLRKLPVSGMRQPAMSG